MVRTAAQQEEDQKSDFGGHPVLAESAGKAGTMGKSSKSAKQASKPAAPMADGFGSGTAKPKMKTKEYEREMRILHGELVALQE